MSAGSPHPRVVQDRVSIPREPAGLACVARSRLGFPGSGVVLCKNSATTLGGFGHRCAGTIGEPGAGRGLETRG